MRPNLRRLLVLAVPLAAALACPLGTTSTIDGNGDASDSDFSGGKDGGGIAERGDGGAFDGGADAGAIDGRADEGQGGVDAGGPDSAMPPVTGEELFVAVTGDDANPGTRDNPLKTLAAAQAAVRASSNRGKEPITVTVLSGTYYVGKTLVFTPADSGSQAAPVTYRGSGTATLSGGARLELTWTPYKNDILQAKVSANASDSLSFDALFLNGQRQRMARYPNYRAGVVPFGGGSADAVSPSRVGGWSHSPVGGFVHGLHSMKWGSEHYVIKGVDGSRNLSLDGPLCNARPSGLLNGSQVVENIFDELDAPGEWYFDRGAGVLYFYPPQGTDLATATLEVAGIERIVEFTGTSTAPVRWINLDGFRYTHTSRTFAKCNEAILRSDWQIYRGGAVFLTGAEDSAIRNSFFDQVGGAGLFVSGYNRRVSVSGNKGHASARKGAREAC